MKHNVRVKYCSTSTAIVMASILMPYMYSNSRPHKCEHIYGNNISEKVWDQAAP